jgi:hypothetical protein
MQELSKEKDAKIEDLQRQINELKVSAATASAQSNKSLSLPEAMLLQNAPNPFNNSTTISCMLPATFVSAKIVITDKNGNILRQENISGGGKRSLNMNASALTNGTYNYSLIVDGKLINTKQMILAK